MEKKDGLKFNSSVAVTDNFYSNEDWKFERPVWDTEKCIRCGVCYLSCPDGAIFQNDEGYYESDVTFCKGCGICKQQCLTGCISMETSFELPPWVMLIRKIIS